MSAQQINFKLTLPQTTFWNMFRSKANSKIVHVTIGCYASIKVNQTDLLIYYKNGQESYL